MKNLQIRLDEDLVEEMDELAADLRLLRSDVARRAIDEGLRRLRLERAMEKYLHRKFSLCRAAEYAGVSIVEAADEAAKRGIPFFRYSPRELEQDIEVARRARRG